MHIKQSRLDYKLSWGGIAETSVLIGNLSKIERCSLSGMPKHVLLEYESFDMVWWVKVTDSKIYQ